MEKKVLTKDEITQIVNGLVDARIEEYVKAKTGLTLPEIANFKATTEAQLKEAQKQWRAFVDAEQEASRIIGREITERNIPKEYRAKAPALFASDAHGGAGFCLARFVRCTLAADLRRENPCDVAKSWGDMWLAEKLEEARDPNFAKALGWSVSADGGYLIPPDFFAEYIPLLRSAAVVLAMGARTIEMDSHTLPIPRVVSGTASTWGHENVETNATTMAFGVEKLVLKTLKTILPVSNEWLRMPGVDKDQLLRDDIMMSQALAMDLAFIRGAGSLDSPKGIRFRTSNVSPRSQAAPPSTLAEIRRDLRDMIEDVEGNNVPLVSAGWIFPSREKHGLARKVDANSNAPFESEINQGRLLGHPFGISNQIPKDLGAGDETEVYFGAFANAFVGLGKLMEFKGFDGATYRDPSGNLVSGLSANQTVLRMIQMADFILRYERSFSVLTNVDWGADA